MIHKTLGALAGTALLLSLGTVPASASGGQTCAVGSAQAEAALQPKKKKGFGLGGLLKAAKNAGDGDMLTGGMLGRSGVGQVAGAVAGTAMSASDGDASGAASGLLSGLAGAGRAAQIAGAVTGTAANLARSGGGAPQRSSSTGEGACASDVGAVVNLYK